MRSRLLPLNAKNRGGTQGEDENNESNGGRQMFQVMGRTRWAVVNIMGGSRKNGAHRHCQARERFQKAELSSCHAANIKERDHLSTDLVFAGAFDRILQLIERCHQCEEQKAQLREMISGSIVTRLLFLSKF